MSSTEIAGVLEAEVASGDRAVDAWLRDQVMLAAQALKADPSRALSPAQVREQLATRRRSRTIPPNPA